MNKLEKLRDLVLQELSVNQCKAEMPYDYYRLVEIEGGLCELRWVLCRIDELIKEDEENG